MADEPIEPVAGELVERSERQDRWRKDHKAWRPDKVRERIKIQAIVNMLHEHLRGERKLNMTQIRCAEILLSKALPSLQAIEVNVTGEVVIHDVSDRPLTPIEWEAQAQDSLGTANGAASPTH